MQPVSFEFADAPRLPVIDLALTSGAGRPWLDHLGAQLDWAASEFGFFYVVGHGIERATIASLHEGARAFFAWPTDRKLELHMSRGGRAWRGWFPVGGELTSGRPDLKEGLYLALSCPTTIRACSPAYPCTAATCSPTCPASARRRWPIYRRSPRCRSG